MQLQVDLIFRQLLIVLARAEMTGPTVLTVHNKKCVQ